MSILFVLITFLLFITISYFRSQKHEAEAVRRQLLTLPGRRAPQTITTSGFEIPKGYCFHPGHTWVLDEGRQNARIGLDSFAASLLGKIDRIEVVGLNRWVRQGQKIWTVRHDGQAIDMVSPIEGIVLAANPNVLQNPSLATKDPYGDGWVLVVKSPELAGNLNNLIQGSWVRAWMQSTLDRLAALTSQHAPALAQDGGLPVAGLLHRLEPGVQRRLIREFLLT